jgi:hypothetical protein
LQTVATLPHISRVMVLVVGLPVNVDKTWTMYFACGYGMAAYSLTLKQCNILVKHMQYLGVAFNTSTQRKPIEKPSKSKPSDYP